MPKVNRSATRKGTLATTVASFTVHLIPEDDGGYSVIVPALPGCNTQGDSLHAAEKNAREAIALYLETLVEDGLPIPDETRHSVLRRITVPVQIRPLRT